MDLTELRINRLNLELSWIKLNEFGIFNEFEFMKRTLF